MTDSRNEQTNGESRSYRVLRRVAVFAAYATLFVYALILGLSGRF